METELCVGLQQGENYSAQENNITFKKAALIKEPIEANKLIFEESATLQNTTIKAKSIVFKENATIANTNCTTEQFIFEGEHLTYDGNINTTVFFAQQMKKFTHTGSFVTEYLFGPQDLDLGFIEHDPLPGDIDILD